MGFKYFKAVKSEILGLLLSSRCVICGSISECYQFDYYLNHKTKDLHKEVRDANHKKIGCFQCLQEYRFGFCHDTEVGFINHLGLHRIDEFQEKERPRVFMVGDMGGTTMEHNIINRSRPLPISPEHILEMQCTPSFPTWQDICWPVHCNDFMAYLGNWKPSDFFKFNNGRGKELFLSMTDRDYYKLWKDNMSLEKWSICYYAFQCTICNEYKGIVDYD